jgi:hypothetical protein
MRPPRLRSRRSAIALMALLVVAMGTAVLRPGPPAVGSPSGRPRTDALGGRPPLEATALDLGRSVSAELSRDPERIRFPGLSGVATLSALVAMAVGRARRSRRAPLGGALGTLVRVVASRAPPPAV